MLELTHGWTMEVERGPDWLLIRVHPAAHDPAAEEIPLAEQVWEQLELHMAHRAVLDLTELPLLRSMLIGQLVRLKKRMHAASRVLRVCGLSESNRETLQLARLADQFPHYPTRDDAIRGECRPRQPR